MKMINNLMTRKEFRKIMETPGTKFHVEGQMFCGSPTVFVMGDGYVTGDHRSMNIGYMGDTKMDLYSFDMMSNKTTATIKFKNVIIIK